MEALVSAKMRAEAAIMAGKVVTEAPPGAKISLKLQGNMAFYSRGALQRRTQLQSHPQLKRLFRRNWRCLTGHKRTGHRKVGFEGYCRFYSMIHRVLVPPEQDDVEEVTEEELLCVRVAVRRLRGADRFDTRSRL